VTKFKLDQLEAQFADEDVFDTSAADNILNLVSLANKVKFKFSGSLQYVFLTINISHENHENIF